MQGGAYYTIGSSHVVCEDYAIGRQNYGIISDGCSNGRGPRIDTDWGARLLAKAAEEHLYRMNAGFIDWVSDEKLVRAIIEQAAIQVRCLGVTRECLSATLGIAFVTCGIPRVLLAGDGIYGAKRRDGSVVFYHVEYQPGGTEKNYPACFYPRYLLELPLFDGYLSRFGGTYKVTTYMGTWDDLKVSEELFGTQRDHFLHGRSFDVKDHEFVFVGSDGWGTFFKQNPEVGKPALMVPVEHAVRMAINFTDNTPGFVERQCQWLFRRNEEGTFVRLGWQHSDDVSFGVLYCGEKP